MPAALLDRVAVIKALAHPTRLRLAEALAERPRCAGELRDLIGADFSTVSKHLALMREAGWIESDKRGLHVHYRLACHCLPDFLRCIDSLATP